MPGPDSLAELPAPRPLPQSDLAGLGTATLDLSKSMSPPPKQGRMNVAVLLAHWPTALSAAKAMPHVDAEVRSICAHFFEPMKFHLASRVVLQKLLGVERPQALKRKLLRVAASFFLHQVYERQLLEKRLSQMVTPASRILYLEAGAYDETPLRLSLKTPLPTSSSSSTTWAAGHNLPHVATEAGLDSTTSSQSLICKVLQTKSSFGMVLRLSAGIVGITGSHFCPLQSMGRTSGEVLAECLARGSPNSQQADTWPLKCRAICADRAGFNRRGEEILSNVRAHSWQSCILPCDLHGVAGCHRRAFDGLLSRDITGMLRTSLSLRLHSSWSTFRLALSQVIAARLHIRFDHPPASAEEYKQHVLPLCLDGGAASGLECMVRLLGVATGDWQNRDQVEVYWREADGPVPPHESLAHRVAGRLVEALAHRQPHLWRRDRWTGFKEAVSDLLLLEVVHGLLAPAYSAFCQLLTLGSTADAPEQGTSFLSTSGHGISEPGPAQQTDAILPLAAGGEDNAGLPATEVPDIDVQLPSQAEQNAKDRSKALSWIQDEPLSHLLLIRLALQPLTTLQNRVFQISGEAWEQTQQAKEAIRLLQGEGEPRDYRVSVAASGELENRFFAELSELYTDQSSWCLAPPATATMRYRALSFKVLSCLGCALMQLVAHPHKCYPVKLFRLLREPEMGPDLAAEAPCIKDAYTQHLQRSHPTLEGEELQASLKMHALHQAVDIGGIETRHASVRRQVVLLSVQTWRRDFSQASCDWLLQNLRGSRRKSGFFLHKVRALKQVEWGPSGMW